MANDVAGVIAAYKAARKLLWSVWGFDNTCRNWHPDVWANATDFSNCLPVVELQYVPTKAERCDQLFDLAAAIRDGLEELTEVLGDEGVFNSLVMANDRPATIAGHHESCFCMAIWSVASDRYESVLAFQESRPYSPVMPPQSRDDYPLIHGETLTPANLDEYLRGAGWSQKWDIELATLELSKEAQRAAGKPVSSFSEALKNSGVSRRRAGRKLSKLSVAILEALDRGDHVDDIAIRLDTTRDNIRTVKARHGADAEESGHN